MQIDYRQLTLPALRVKRDYYTPRQVSEIFHKTYTVCMGDMPYMTCHFGCVLPSVMTHTQSNSAMQRSKLQRMRSVVGNFKFSLHLLLLQQSSCVLLSSERPHTAVSVRTSQG